MTEIKITSLSEVKPAQYKKFSSSSEELNLYLKRFAKNHQEISIDNTSNLLDDLDQLIKSSESKNKKKDFPLRELKNEMSLYSLLRTVEFTGPFVIIWQCNPIHRKLATAK